MRFVLIALDGLRPDMVSPSGDAAPRAPRRGWYALRECAQRLPLRDAGCDAVADHGLPAGRAWNGGEHALRRRRRAGPLLRTKLLSDVMLMARGGESPLQRPSLGERLAAAGRSFALVSSGTRAPRCCCTPAGRTLGLFRWNVEDSEGEPPPAARALRPDAGAGGAEPPAARHLSRVLLEHVLPERRPDVTLVWLSEPDISFHWGGLLAPHAVAALRAAMRWSAR
jgi:hypothetical protein